MALAYCSIWTRFSSSSSSSMSSAPPENMLSEEDDARLVIEREGVVVVVNAYVWEMAAAHAAMVRADVFMVVSVLFCRVTALLHQLNAKIYSVLQELALAVDMFVELKIFFETWKCKTVGHAAPVNLAVSPQSLSQVTYLKMATQIDASKERIS